MSHDVILEARDLKRFYEVSRGGFRKKAVLKALNGATFDLEKGRTLAVVGESGCGKSTLARLLTMIEPPTAGTLKIRGVDIVGSDSATRRKLKSKIQIIFQDPYGSLNPRQKIGHALEEPLLVNTAMSRQERSRAAREMMKLVGLRPEQYDRYPHMFSGGQRQRIAVARALMLNPEILILDEPVSALDVSIQAQILNLLAELQQRLNLAYLFISHDLSVVRHIADEVMVMYLGVPIEKASRDELFTRPRHPYTRALLSATPTADPLKEKQRIVLHGELPSPIDPPPGCSFNPRCSRASAECLQKFPEMHRCGKTQVACYHPYE